MTIKRAIPSKHLAITSVAAAVAAILAAPRVTWAQSADATLQGTAAANAEVSATNKNTGLTRRTKASADGSYVLMGLPPGPYTVKSGSVTQDVTLSVATVSSLDLGGGEIETVTVAGRRLVEVKTSEIGAIVSQETIANVPQLTRNFLEFADSVPGAIFNIAPNGATTFRSGASTPDSANIFIDGVGQKGYVRGGQAGQTDGSQGNPFPQAAIQEYKVITSNYKAEYDQLSSAAITAATKSGTNEFHGAFSYTWSNDGLRAPTPAERVSGHKVKSKVQEPSLSIGGPIIQDKAHFFVAYERKDYSQPVAVTYANNPSAAIIAALPAAAQAQIGPSSIPFKEDLVFGKIDFEPNDVDRFEITAKYRKENSTGNGAGVGQAASTSIVTRNTDYRYDIHWIRTADRWSNAAVLATENAFFRPTAGNAYVNGNNYTYQDGPNDKGILNTDGADPRATQDKGQKGWSFQDDLTFANVGLGAGLHTFKMGIKYKAVELTASDACGTCYPTFTYNVSAAGMDMVNGSPAPYSVVFGTLSGLADPTVKSKDRQLGLYFQDDWNVNNHLTLNLGMRWDAEWNPSYLDWVTPTQISDMFLKQLSPNCTAPATCTETWADMYRTRGLYTFDVNNYIGNGRNRHAQLNQFQPRLGFSYDVHGDQKLVVSGGFGRSYDRDLFDYLQLEQVKLATSEPSLHFNTTSHPCTVDGVSCLTWDPALYLHGPAALQQIVKGTVGDVFLFNNNLKAPYSDQFSLGIRTQLGEWNTSAMVARVNSHDGFTFLVGNRSKDGAFWVQEPWGGYGTPWNIGQGIYTPVGMTNNLVLSSNGGEIRTTQLMLSANKPYTDEARWGTTISYTYTDAKTNAVPNDQGGGFTATEFSADYPTMSVYPWAQSTSAPKHRLVATAILKMPWDMRLGAKLTISSPLPGWASQCYSTAGAGQTQLLFPLGNQCHDGVLNNPLTIGYKSLDLQLTKDFRVGERVKLTARVDLLNALNTDNLNDYSYVSFLPDGRVNGIAYNPTGNVAGPMRQLRLTVGGSF